VPVDSQAALLHPPGDAGVRRPAALACAGRPLRKRFPARPRWLLPLRMRQSRLGRRSLAARRDNANQL